ncbi:FUSC family protein [uncultured Methanobacterium sp.]|uniref:FUSC family protein n=1 Tax=uncultured Methanobacterium sp. TaxID=176306 RepID=UPI002AA93940|nr:FUSC family protein [uncultured Methanobacterium sp.]
MERKGLISRFKRLSAPTGKPLWGHAFRAVGLAILSVIIAYFIGLRQGIEIIFMVVLFASVLMDQAIPFRKSVTFSVIGFILMSLAFVSASVAHMFGLPFFIVLTIIWSFFPFTLYIFGKAEGLFGYLIFISYYTATVLIKSSTNVFDLITYVLFAYLIASILLVWKFIQRDNYKRKMVASGFDPNTSIKKIGSVRRILAGVPINESYHHLFDYGLYLTGLRNYGRTVQSRLTGKVAVLFENFLNESNSVSSAIADHIVNKKGEVNLKNVKSNLNELNLYMDEKGVESVKFLADNFIKFFEDSNRILSSPINKNEEETVKMTPLNKMSFKQVITSRFNLDSLYIRHALRFTIAMVITLSFVFIDHSRDPAWIAMGVLIVLKPDVTSTWDNMITRVSFNLFAVILAIILAFIFPHYMLLIFALVALFFFRAFLPNYIGLSILAVSVFTVFVWPQGEVINNAAARIIDILIGSIVSIILVYGVLPKRLMINLPDQVSNVLKVNQDYSELVLSGNYDIKTATSKLETALLEYNNLESSLKKVQDTFKDVSKDLEIYEEISGACYNLTEDISAIVGYEHDSKLDFSPLIDLSSKILDVLVVAIEKDEIPEELPDMHIYSKLSDTLQEQKEIKQYFEWIVSDIYLIHYCIKKAVETGALTRYKNIN